MIYTYNSVSFEIEHLEIEANSVYDDSGTDYLYTHFRIHVEAIWNPGATKDTSVVGHEPPASESFTNLGAKLRQPRRPLSIIWPNHDASVNGGLGVPLIQSPAAVGFSGTDGRTINVTPYLTDAKNGPIVIGDPEITFFGEKSARISHVVETWLVECSDQRPLISNRWSMRKVRDQDYWETRIIDGTAIFRSDMLYKTTRDAAGNLQPLQYPSQFLSQLITPCPYGFKRVGPDFTQHEDGVTLDYHVEDVQQPLAFTDRYRAAISRIEGTYVDDHSVAQLPGNTVNQAIGFSSARQDIFASILRAGAPANPANQGHIDDLWRAFHVDQIVQGIRNGLVDFQNSFPTRIITLSITAYGTPLAKKNDLLNALLAVAGNYRVGADATAGFMGFFKAAARHYLQTVQVRLDVWNKRADLLISMKLPGASGYLLAYLGIANPPDLNWGQVNSTLEEAAPVATIAQRNSSATSIPPENNGTQGTIGSPAAAPAPNSPCVAPPRLDNGAANGPTTDNGGTSFPNKGET
jgi:hypothetical protein